MVRVVGGGKVTVLKRVRDLLGVCGGDYVRLSLLEVIKKRGSGEDVGGEKFVGR